MGAWARCAIAAISVLSVSTISAPAMAQGRARLTLFSQHSLRGNRVTLTRSTPDLRTVGFNDVAASLRATGRWRVCEHIRYRGRCETVRGTRSSLRLAGLISSARFEGF
jgi:hypothetical protein